MSNHPDQAKGVVVISLVDKVWKLASRENISNELIFIKDILIGNGHPEKMILQITLRTNNFAVWPKAVTKIKKRTKQA